MEEKRIRYSGADVTVSYTLKRCIHAAECVNGLPAVFDPASKPWVKADKAPADEVAEVILRCPSGALKFERHDGGAEETPPQNNSLLVDPDGPLYIRGRIIIKKTDGEVLLEDTRLALCRCGASKNKPLCDGSHSKIDFEASGRLGEPKLKPVEGDESPKIEIVLAENGPLLFEGVLELVSADGEQKQVGRKGALCRCGASSNKPYCDGTHKTIEFKS